MTNPQKHSIPNTPTANFSIFPFSHFPIFPFVPICPHLNYYSPTHLHFHPAWPVPISLRFIFLHSTTPGLWVSIPHPCQSSTPDNACPAIRKGRYCALITQNYTHYSSHANKITSSYTIPSSQFNTLITPKITLILTDSAIYLPQQLATKTHKDQHTPLHSTTPPHTRHPHPPSSPMHRNPLHPHH